MPPRRQSLGTWEQMCSQARKRARPVESESEQDADSDDDLSTVSEVARARQLSPPPHATTLAKAGPPRKRCAATIRRSASGISTATMSSTSTQQAARRSGASRAFVDDDARSSASVDSIGVRSNASSHPFLKRSRPNSQMRWQDEELLGLGEAATGAPPRVAFGSNAVA